MRDAVQSNGRVMVAYYDGDFDFCTHCGERTIKVEERYGPIDGQTGQRPLKIRCVCPRKRSGWPFDMHTDQFVWPRTPRPMPVVIADTPIARPTRRKPHIGADR